MLRHMKSKRSIIAKIILSVFLMNLSGEITLKMWSYGQALKKISKEQEETANFLKNQMKLI